MASLIAAETTTWPYVPCSHLLNRSHIGDSHDPFAAAKVLVHASQPVDFRSEMAANADQVRKGPF